MNVMSSSATAGTPGRAAGPSRRSVAWRLAKFALLLFVVNVGCWAIVDSRSFVPPSEGVLLERALFCGVTAAGPFAMAIDGRFSNLAMGLVVECGLVGAFIAAALIGRRHVAARALGYLGVTLWFFFGFAVAGLRIT
jgi:hypothetical protein